MNKLNKVFALSLALAAVVTVNTKAVRVKPEPQVFVAATTTMRLMAEMVEEIMPVSAPAPVPAVVYQGMLTPSGYTEQELAAVLHGPMKEYAWCFIQAEEETGINAAFLASVAGLESGWGRSNLAVRRNNLFGWTAKGSYMTFASKEDCIAYVARNIKDLYLTPGGRYFRGYEIADINVHYNGQAVWQYTVEDIMRQMVRKAEANRLKSATV